MYKYCMSVEKRPLPEITHFFLPLWLNCAIAQLCTLSWKLIWPRNAGAESCNSIQSFAFLHKLFLHFSRTSQFSFIQSLKSFGLRLQRSQPILFPFSKKLIWGYCYNMSLIYLGKIQIVPKN